MSHHLRRVGVAVGSLVLASSMLGGPGAAKGEVLPIAPSSTAQNWPQPRFGSEQTGFNPLETKLNGQTAGGLKLRQTKTLPYSGAGTPIVVDGIAYTTDGNELFAVELATNVTLWRLAAFGQPTYAKGLLYLNDGAGVTAVSALTGVIVWQHPFSPSASVGAPSVRNGLVYVTADGSVFALDAVTGAQVWQAYTPWSGGRDVVAARDDAVFVASAYDPSVVVPPPAGAVSALDAHTGTLLWEHETTAQPTAPVAGTDAVYFTDGPRVTALAASDGAQLWQTTAPVSLDDQLALADGLVFGGSMADGSFFAWRAADGTAQWAINPGYGQIISAASVAGGVVFQNFSAVGALGAFDERTGRQLWITYLDTNTVNQGPPAVVNGKVLDLACSYLCPNGSTLYVFGI